MELMCVHNQLDMPNCC